MKIVPKVDRLPCRHPKRFVDQRGRARCETCAEIAAGWRECSKCREFSPPPTDAKKQKHHRPDHRTDALFLCSACMDRRKATACEDCDGLGSFDCEETGCHGEYCDLGVAECETCHGRGYLLAVAS